MINMPPWPIGPPPFTPPQNYNSSSSWKWSFGLLILQNILVYVNMSNEMFPKTGPMSTFRGEEVSGLHGVEVVISHFAS